MQTCKAAFSSIGIHPFNSEVIALEQMKSSESTLIKSQFPLSQASSTWAVIAAFQYQGPIAFDLSLSTYQLAAHGTPTTLPTPETPTKQYALDSKIDPSLYIPFVTE